MSSIDPAPDPVSRPRILLVEDDAPVRRSLQLMLLGQGYEVRAYASGVGLAHDSEALQAGCLVADLRMPGKDALELLRELRAVGWAGRAILISGHLDAAIADQARGAGFDVILPKPLPERVLNHSVAELVGRTRLVRSF